jgi:hypothetical protein
MRLTPLGLAAYPAPADAARGAAAGCDSLTPLRFPGGTGSTVLEGTVPRGGRACWTVHLDAGRRLDLRLTSTEGDAAVEVRSRTTHAAGSPTARSRVGAESFASSSVSSSSSGGSAGGGHTRLSIGPQSPGGEFLIAVGTTRGAPASYRLEVTLR